MFKNTCTFLQLKIVKSVSHVWLCNHTVCSTPGLPVLHHLLEFPQTRVHWVSDAIQPSHPLSSPSPLSLQSSSMWVFSNESGFCIRWTKYWSFNFSISLPMNIQDWFPLGCTGWISLWSKGISRVFSNTKFKSINSSMLSFPYRPTLTPIHNY